MLIWLILIGLSVFRISLMVSTPAYLIGNSGYDDAFQVNQALQICVGNWLDEYCVTTLSKGISFPVFLCLAKLLCMPYFMLLGIFYCASAAAFLTACRSEIKNPWAKLVIYAYLISNPVGFSGDVTQRIYRNAILYPTVLLVISAFIGAFLRKDRPKKEYVPWLVLSGAAFTFFYYIREDSVWLMPMVIAVAVLIAVWSLMHKKNRKRLVLLVIPVMIFFGVTVAYKAVNYKVYGEFIICDRTDGYFAEVTEKFLQVEEGQSDDKTAWVSRETLTKIIEECPSLKEGEDLILGYYNSWAGEDNIKGDLYVWALRDAFQEMGHFSSADELQRFSKQVCEEMDCAFEEGRLHENGRIFLSPQARGLERDEISGFLKHALRNWYDEITYKCATYTGLTPAVGSESEIRVMEAMTGAHGIRGINSEGDEDSLGYMQGYIATISYKAERGYIVMHKLILVIAVLCWLLLLVNYIRKPDWNGFEKIIVPFGLLLNTIVLEIGLAFMVEWLGYLGIWFYSSGILPLLSVFEILSIYGGISLIRRGAGKNKENIEKAEAEND